MSALKRFVEEGDTRAGKAFHAGIQILIVLSLLSYSIETLPDLSSEQKTWLDYFEWFSVIVFSIDYLLRLIVATPKRSYAFIFFGLVDLASILPFYLGLVFVGLGLDLRAVRAFRLLRVLRLFKLGRYNAALRRFERAFVIAREEFILFVGATIVLLYLAAIGIHFFEAEAQPKTFGTVFHCLWWAVTTLTTVGYGDVYPITVGGRIFTFVILMIGLGVIAIPVGLLGSALSKARELEDAAEKPGGDLNSPAR